MKQILSNRRTLKKILRVDEKSRYSAMGRG